jgi:hypothetical protein
MDHIKLDQVWQLGIVVDDAEKIADNYASMFGLDKDDFIYMDTRDLDEENWHSTIWNGKPVKFDLKVVLIACGGIQFELIEPIGGDENEYSYFLKTKGGGLHHVCTVFKDYENTLDYFQKNGIKILTQGSMTGGDYKYFDLREQLGVIFETAPMTVEMARAMMGVDED